MRVELIDPTSGISGTPSFGMTVLLNEHTAIDAGTLGFLWPISRQRQVSRVFLSHSHMDHVAALPSFLDNVYGTGLECPTVLAGPETLKSLQSDLFNDRLWPDFVRLSEQGPSFLHLQQLSPLETVEANELRVTPWPLSHVVPVLGFLVEDSCSAVAFLTDTGPCDSVWERLNACESLKAVFLECSFPRRHEPLATASGHLSVTSFAGEIAKLRRSVPVIAYHLKPAFHEEIVDELQRLQQPNVEVIQPGRVYTF